LKKVNLLENYADSKEDNINALFKMALERVAFLPFGLLIDKWRWDVFSGKVEEKEWNAHWWKLREEYQMVSPPSTRGEEFFDPGAKYHIPADSQYMAYFIAHILQFQMHRALCIEAGQYNPDKANENPLHKCDIDKSLKAGKKIRAGLELGLSKHWSEALMKMTGESKIDGSAVLEYFQPLYEYLKEENAKDGVSSLIPGFLTIVIAVFVSISTLI
jgi:peptidyl-dipeptidase A